MFEQILLWSLIGTVLVLGVALFKREKPFSFAARQPLEPELVEAWHNEQVMDEDAQSILNWKQVDEDDRIRCVDHLRYTLSDEVGMMIIWTWRKEAESGLPIGHGDPWFHDGLGSFVRKTLREIMSDDKLPEVLGYDVTGPKQSWDHVYLGAIYELIEE